MRFIPERLRDIRILNDYTVEKVSEYLGVTKQAVSKYENGGAIPTTDVLNGLIDLFSLPAGYLTKEIKEPVPKSEVFYRRNRQTPKKEMDFMGICLKWFYELSAVSKKYGEYAILNLPDWKETESIEEKAVRLRNFWKLGTEPIADMVSLLEQHGFYIFTLDLQNNKIDGGFQCFGNMPVVILNASKGSKERKNFSLAHELGHLVLHSDAQQKNEEEVENEANLFAACFLMPAADMKQEFIRVDADSLIAVGEKWGVSPQAVLERCVELELLDGNSDEIKAHVNYLYRKLNKRIECFKAEEYNRCSLHDLLEKIGHDRNLEKQFLNELRFPIKEIQRLCGMPELFAQYEGRTVNECVGNMDGVQLSFTFKKTID